MKVLRVLFTLLIMISATSCKENKPIQVKGVVYAKSTERHISTLVRSSYISSKNEFLYAVRPLDQKTYKNFTLELQFENYAEFNVGDTIIATTYPEKCLRKYTPPIGARIIYYGVLGILSLLCVYIFVLSIFNIFR